MAMFIFECCGFNGGFSFSDHRQIVLSFDNTNTNNEDASRKRRGRFHYEDYWASVDGHRDTVSSAWLEGLMLNQNDPLQAVNSAIYQCVEALKQWKKGIQQNFGKEIEKRRRQI